MPVLPLPALRLSSSVLLTLIALAIMATSCVTAPIAIGTPLDKALAGVDPSLVGTDMLLTQDQLLLLPDLTGDHAVACPVLCLCYALPLASMVCSPASSRALQMRLQRYLSCCATLMFQQQAAQTALVMTSYRWALSPSDHVQFHARLAAYAVQAHPVHSVHSAEGSGHLVCGCLC